MARLEKVCSLKDAVSNNIHDGMRIACGGWNFYQRPLALVHEIIRSGVRNLTIVGGNDTVDVDMMIGAGCVSHVETSYVGLERFGLARNFKRALEEGTITVTYYPEMLSVDRFTADRMGFDFLPVSFLNGSDIVNKNPNIVRMQSPYSGKPVALIPSAKVDAAIIHTNIADKYGNIQIQKNGLLPQTITEIIAMSSPKVIASVERVVDNSEIRENPYQTTVAGFKTTCIVEAPHGSHPTSTIEETKTDETFMQMYVEAQKTKESFAYFLDKYIYGVKDFNEYLDLVGRQQVEALKER